MALHGFKQGQRPGYTMAMSEAVSQVTLEGRCARRACQRCEGLISAHGRQGPGGAVARAQGCGRRRKRFGGARDVLAYYAGHIPAKAGTAAGSAPTRCRPRTAWRPYAACRPQVASRSRAGRSPGAAPVRPARVAGLQHVAVVGHLSAARAFCSTSRIDTPVLRSARSSRRSRARSAAPGRGWARRASAAAGCAISARPIASIWRSPPDSVPACCARRSFRRGKSAYTSSIVSRQPARSPLAPAAAAEQQVVLHRHRAEQLALLRHQRDAAPSRAPRA